MSYGEIVNRLEELTKNIEYSFEYEDKESITINCTQKHFLENIHIVFYKDLFKRENYIEFMVREIIDSIGHKCFERKNV